MALLDPDDGGVTHGSVKALASDVIEIARENQIGLVASGVAFYLFNSLVALLLFTLVGLSAAGWFEATVELFGTLAGIDVEGLLSALDSLVGEGGGRGRAVVIAGLILAWSSLRLVQAINVAVQTIHDVREEYSLSRTVLNSLVVFMTFVVLVPVASLLVVALTAVTNASSVRILAPPLLGLVLLGGFLPMYYQFPGTETTLRQAFPGAVLAAIVWTVGAVGLRLYITTSQSVKLYGIAGGVLLLLTWLYFGGLTLLTGAILNAILADSIEVDADTVEVDDDTVEVDADLPAEE